MIPEISQEICAKPLRVVDASASWLPPYDMDPCTSLVICMQPAPCDSPEHELP